MNLLWHKPRSHLHDENNEHGARHNHRHDNRTSDDTNGHAHGENQGGDIALLLLPGEAEQAGRLALSDLHLQLEMALGRDVDLLNARLVATVFQKAIIFGELIYCADRYAVDEFEMLTLSCYQKLNEERAEILAEFRRTGRAYAV